jgi:hypothetical protein
MNHRTRPRIQASRTGSFKTDGSEDDRDDEEEADFYENDDRDYSL